MNYVVLVIALVVSTTARGDIIAWRDVEGIRHYTNLREEIPEPYRQEAKVVVDEALRRRAPEPEPLPAEAAPAPEAPRQAQVVYDRSFTADAYQAGLERGLELAGAGPPASVGGGSVQINGPLAIAVAPQPEPAIVYPWPYEYPFLTTSFDRGRSRHLTMRLLMQDQFVLDRDGPYAYVDRAPLLPPNLPVFLPRGLNCRGPCQKRVIAR